MAIAQHDYAFAYRTVTLAVAAMLAERTVHEGLLVAHRDYLQWLELNTDLPPDTRRRIRTWRAELWGDDAAGDLLKQMRGVRALSREAAARQAATLIDIASNMPAPPSHSARSGFDRPTNLCR